jgi:hypothetical protein
MRHVKAGSSPIETAFLPSNSDSNGSKSSNLEELGSITTGISCIGLGLAWGYRSRRPAEYSLVNVRYRKRNKDIPGVNPSAGKVSPFGGENLKTLPSGVMSSSFVGLNESFPLNAIAVTIVGEERKFMVSLLPSLRALKFLYYPVSRSRYAKSTITIPIEGRQYCCRE